MTTELLPVIQRRNPEKEFEILKQIGSGTYGEVFKVGRKEERGGEERGREGRGGEGRGGGGGGGGRGGRIVRRVVRRGGEGRRERGFQG